MWQCLGPRCSAMLPSHSIMSRFLADKLFSRAGEKVSRSSCASVQISPRGSTYSACIFSSSRGRKIELLVKMVRDAGSSRQIQMLCILTLFMSTKTSSCTAEIVSLSRVDQQSNAAIPDEDFASILMRVVGVSSDFTVRDTCT